METSARTSYHSEVTAAEMGPLRKYQGLPYVKLIRRGQALLQVGYTHEQVDRLPMWAWGAVRDEDGAQVYLVHQEDIGPIRSDGTQLVNLINRDDREKGGNGYKHRMKMIDACGSTPTRAYAIPLVAKTSSRGAITYRAIEEELYRIVGFVRPDDMTIDAVILRKPNSQAEGWL